MGSVSSSTRKPNSKVMGKPTVNRLSCGAARVITPKAMLISSSATIAGSAIVSAPENIRPTAAARSHMLATVRPAGETGRVWKLSARTSMSARWPSSARNTSVTSTM